MTPDPIDWAALGMPEGVRVRRDFRGYWYAPTFCTGNEVHMGARRGTVYVSADFPLAVSEFPVLEAFMRAARAIEAGEVELGGGDE